MGFVPIKYKTPVTKTEQALNIKHALINYYPASVVAITACVYVAVLI